MVVAQNELEAEVRAAHAALDCGQANSEQEPLQYFAGQVTSLHDRWTELDFMARQQAMVILAGLASTMQAECQAMVEGENGPMATISTTGNRPPGTDEAAAVMAAEACALRNGVHRSPGTEVIVAAMALEAEAVQGRAPKVTRYERCEP